MKKRLLNILVGIGLVSFMSCNDDFLDHNPTDKISSDELLATEGSVKAAVNGIYNKIGNPNNSYFSLYHLGFSKVNEVRAEDVMGNDLTWWALFDGAYTYNSTKADNLGPYIWDYSYAAIDQCNVIINDGLEAIDDDDVRKDYIAQAKAIRAMVYWDLVGVFARPYIADNGASPGVLLITESEHGKSHPRTTVKAIYDQIFKDLTEALADISSLNDQKRVNEAMINGLLARYYLDLNNYQNAMEHAEAAANSVDLMSADELRLGLSGLPSEGIFTLVNTEDAYAEYRTHTSYWDDYDGMGKDIRIPQEFADLFQAPNSDPGEPFPKGDIRRDFFWSQYNWKNEPGWGYYYTGKALEWEGPDYGGAYLSAQQDNSSWGWPGRLYMYGKFPRQDFECSDIESYVKTASHELVSNWGTVGLGNYVYMRSSEMVLVVAECAARLKQETKAKNALRLIQARAFNVDTEDYPLSPNSNQALIDEIMLEKRKELLGEGHRMRDVMRLRMDIQRFSTWTGKDFISKDDPKMQLPIPDSEIKVNSALDEDDQNPGYK